MASLTTVEAPPFEYNPNCKPVKSILKQRSQLSRQPSSWFSRLSSVSIPENTDNTPVSSTAPQSTPSAVQPRQLGLLGFRKLIANGDLLSNNDSALTVPFHDDQKSATSNMDNELTPEELRRVRFSIKKLTTEYYPSVPVEASSQDSATPEPQDAASPNEAASSELKDSESDNSHVKEEKEVKSAEQSPDRGNKQPPERLNEIYEMACVNKEEPMMHGFLANLNANQLGAKLRRIDLSNQTLTRRVVEPIADVLGLDIGLEELNLRNCGLEDDTLKIVLHTLLLNDTVQRLNLAENKKLKSPGFKYIAIFVKGSSQLRQLDLSATNPDKKAMQYLSQAISAPLRPGERQAPSLSQLNIDSCALKAPLLEILAAGVRKSRCLRHLSLRHNKITSQSAVWLGVMLRDYDDPESSDGLATLFVDNNDIRQGVQYIAQALRRNQSLQFLSLRDCRLDSKSCAFVGEALKYNRALFKLDIGGNSLDQPTFEGFTALKQALYVNRSLKELGLSATGFGSEAAIALAECIPENKTLMHLDLTQNYKIDLAGLLALSAALRINNTLALLDINIPPNDREMALILNEIVASCTRNAQRSPRASPRPQEQPRVPDTPPSLEPNAMITKTQATARLTLQERLAAVTQPKSVPFVKSSGTSVNSAMTVEATDTVAPKTTTTVNTPVADADKVESAVSQVTLLEEMLAAETSQRDIMMDPIQPSGEAIADVYHQCQASQRSISAEILDVTDPDTLVSLLALNDRLTSALDTYQKLFPALSEDATHTDAPPLPLRPELEQTTATILSSVHGDIDMQPLASSFEIGDVDDDDDDDDDDDVVNDDELDPPRHPSPGIEHTEGVHHRGVEI